MNQQVVTLAHVNLSNNLLTALPRLADTGYVRLLHSALRRDDMSINFNLNPLSEAAQAELRAARIRLAGTRRPAIASGVLDQTWQVGCPAALSASIDADREADGTRDFYNIMDQIGRTASYLNDPQGYRERMWTLMRSVVGEDPLINGDGLGVNDLREQLFEQASRVADTCGDGISVVLDGFEVTVLAWQAASSAAEGGQGMFAPLLKLARKLFLASVVDECSVIIAEDRRLRHMALVEGNEPRTPHPLDTMTDVALRNHAHDDEVEIRLLLRNRLQERLGLLDQPAMRYGEVVDQQTLDNVATAVLERDTSSDLLGWLVQQKFWEVYCRKATPEPFETLAQTWDDVLSVYEDVANATPSFELHGERLAQALAVLSTFDADAVWSVEGLPGPVKLNEAQVLLIYGWMRESRWKALDALLTRLAREHLQLPAQEKSL